jgi:hypothetical protein
VNRVLPSTSVPIAELSSPMIRSPLPVPGHGPVLDLGGTLADQNLVGHEALAVTRSSPRHTQRSSGLQTGAPRPTRLTVFPTATSEALARDGCAGRGGDLGAGG